MLGRGTGEADALTARDLRRDRLLVQDGEHALPRREGGLQRGAQVRERHHRAERAHEREHRDEHPVKAHGTGTVKRLRHEQHDQVAGENDGARERRRATGGALHALLVRGKRAGPLVHLSKALRTCAVLQNLVQAAQALQHEARELARTGAEARTGVTSEARRNERARHAHGEIRRRGHSGEQRVEAPDEGAGTRAEEERNRRR